MTSPPPYPRVPHLVPGRGTDDDLVLGPSELDRLLGLELEVEEKLDGANVMVWAEDGTLRSAGRAGPESIDRAGQFGALRAWVAAHPHLLWPLVGDGQVLYGEWLHLTHTIPYRDLPSWFVALDLRRADGEFVEGARRRELLAGTGLVVPPLLGTGRFDLDALEAFGQHATWSDAPGEGVVVRPLAPCPPALRVTKLVRAGFVRLSDEQWRRGRGTNGLALPEA